MLTERHFYAFAFPWIAFSPDGKLVSRGDGCLFSMPEAAKSEICEEHYRNAPAGWSVCSAGYAVYSIVLPALFDYRVVLPGLKVVGISKAQGHSEGLSIRTSVQEIEKYVTRSLTGFDQVEQFIQTLMERSAHEMRQINRDILSAAEDVAHFLKDIPNSEYALVRVNNTRALTEILGSRADFLDYLSSSRSSAATKVPIRPYQKFDKSVRSLKNRATGRSIDLWLSGFSVGMIQALPVFEVIPYLIVENALKFSPAGSRVDVNIEENEFTISIRVSNWGPSMSEQEIARVFEPGFRGMQAIERNIPGSGIGLFFLRDLVESHDGGALQLRQTGDSVFIAGTQHRQTEVLLQFSRFR